MSADRERQFREWGIAALRIVVGFTFLAHGLQKVLDTGYSGVTGFFGSIGIPLPGIGAGVIMVLETVGATLLILGLWTRWVAILLAADMLVALLVVHLERGFFAAEGGIELVALLGAVALTLALSGPGAVALDDVLTRPVRRR